MTDTPDPHDEPRSAAPPLHDVPTAPDPRAETRALCEALVTTVALTRRSGGVNARVDALRRAVLAYPAVPDAADTPVESWLGELHDLAGHLGSRSLEALVRGRQGLLRIRAARLSEAHRLLDIVDTNCPEPALRLVEVARAHLQIAEGHLVDRDRLTAIADGDEPIAALQARLALAESSDAPAALTAWRAVLPRIPGEMLDARLYALTRLLPIDDEQRPLLLRLVAEIHLGCGHGAPVLALASRYPGQLDPAIVDEARITHPPAPPAPPPAIPGWGGAEKFGCGALLVTTFILIVMIVWFRYG